MFLQHVWFLSRCLHVTGTVSLELKILCLCRMPVKCHYREKLDVLPKPDSCSLSFTKVALGGLTRSRSRRQRGLHQVTHDKQTDHNAITCTFWKYEQVRGAISQLRWRIASG